VALRVLWIGLALWIGGGYSASSAPRSVLLLYDERVEVPGLAALNSEFANTLLFNSTDAVEIYREEMDLSRFGSDAYQLLLQDFLRAKYANKRIDVAVAVLGPALDFLLAHGSAIFPGASVVFCGVDRKEISSRTLPPNVHGVLLKREFAPTLQLALQIHPQTTHVVVVAGASDFDTQLLDHAKNEFRAYEGRVTFTYVNGSLRKILSDVSQLPPRTIVLFTSFFRDGAGEGFVSHNVAQVVSEAANAPVYGFVDQYLGRGVVGGSMHSLSEHGAEAANLVLRILADPEHAGPTLLEPPPNKVLFDWRQLQRWGIGEASLPAGSEIRFRELTPWQQYRAQIAAVCAALLAQAALIAWLMYERRRRRVAEVRSHESITELTYLNRRAAAGELSGSIAHEIVQPLAAISAQAQAAIHWLGRHEREEVQSSLRNIVQAVDRASDIIKNLRALFKKDTPVGPVDIDRVITTVVDLVRIELQKHKVELQMQLRRPPAAVGNAVQLQQVVLNLIMNAIEAMHSTTPRILRLKSELTGSSTVRVAVEDTGPGIDPGKIKRVFDPLFTTKASGMGMGLSICNTIIENHGGRIWAEAGAGGGAIFRFDLPLG
jgi:signal transduction histidine kinase